MNSNSLAFDTESFYHKNISIVCIRHIPGKSFLFNNNVICSLDVETSYARDPLQLFALADLDRERQLTVMTVTLRTTSEQCHHNNDTQEHK